MPTGFLVVCRSAESDQFEDMCYSKMNQLFLLFLWQEEVSIVCRAQCVNTKSVKVCSEASMGGRWTMIVYQTLPSKDQNRLHADKARV